jgi:hypothetical protein
MFLSRSSFITLHSIIPNRIIFTLRNQRRVNHVRATELWFTFVWVFRTVVHALVTFWSRNERRSKQMALNVRETVSVPVRCLHRWAVVVIEFADRWNMVRAWLNWDVNRLSIFGVRCGDNQKCDTILVFESVIFQGSALPSSQTRRMIHSNSSYSFLGPTWCVIRKAFHEELRSGWAKWKTIEFNST